MKPLFQPSEFHLSPHLPKAGKNIFHGALLATKNTKVTKLSVFFVLYVANILSSAEGSLNTLCVSRHSLTLGLARYKTRAPLARRLRASVLKLPALGFPFAAVLEREAQAKR